MAVRAEAAEAAAAAAAVNQARKRSDVHGLHAASLVYSADATLAAAELETEVR